MLAPKRQQLVIEFDQSLLSDSDFPEEFSLEKKAGTFLSIIRIMVEDLAKKHTISGYNDDDPQLKTDWFAFAKRTDGDVIKASTIRSFLSSQGITDSEEQNFVLFFLRQLGGQIYMWLALIAQLLMIEITGILKPYGIMLQAVDNKDTWLQFISYENGIVKFRMQQKLQLKGAYFHLDFAIFSTDFYLNIHAKTISYDQTKLTLKHDPTPIAKKDHTINEEDKKAINKLSSIPNWLAQHFMPSVNTLEELRYVIQTPRMAQIKQDFQMIQENDMQKPFIEKLLQYLKWFPTGFSPKKTKGLIELDKSAQNVILAVASDLIKLSNKTISFPQTGVSGSDTRQIIASTDRRLAEAVVLAREDIYGQFCERVKLLDNADSLIKEKGHVSYVRRAIEQSHYHDLSLDDRLRLAKDTGSTTFAKRALSTSGLPLFLSRPTSRNLTAGQLVALLEQFAHNKEVVDEILKVRGLFGGQNFWKKIRDNNQALLRVSDLSKNHNEIKEAITRNNKLYIAMRKAVFDNVSNVESEKSLIQLLSDNAGNELVIDEILGTNGGQNYWKKIIKNPTALDSLSKLYKDHPKIKEAITKNSRLYIAMRECVFDVEKTLQFPGVKKLTAEQLVTLLQNYSDQELVLEEILMDKGRFGHNYWKQIRDDHRALLQLRDLISNDKVKRAIEKYYFLGFHYNKFIEKRRAVFNDNLLLLLAAADTDVVTTIPDKVKAEFKSQLKEVNAEAFFKKLNIPNLFNILRRFDFTLNDFFGEHAAYKNLQSLIFNNLLELAAKQQLNEEYKTGLSELLKNNRFVSLLKSEIDLLNVLKNIGLVFSVIMASPEYKHLVQRIFNKLLTLAEKKQLNDEEKSLLIECFKVSSLKLDLQGTKLLNMLSSVGIYLDDLIVTDSPYTHLIPLIPANSISITEEFDDLPDELKAMFNLEEDAYKKEVENPNSLLSKINPTNRKSLREVALEAAKVEKNVEVEKVDSSEISANIETTYPIELEKIFYLLDTAKRKIIPKSGSVFSRLTIADSKQSSSQQIQADQAEFLLMMTFMKLLNESKQVITLEQYRKYKVNKFESASASASDAKELTKEIEEDWAYYEKCLAAIGLNDTQQRTDFLNAVIEKIYRTDNSYLHFDSTSFHQLCEKIKMDLKGYEIDVQQIIDTIGKVSQKIEETISDKIKTLVSTKPQLTRRPSGEFHYIPEQPPIPSETQKKTTGEEKRALPAGLKLK